MTFGLDIYTDWLCTYLHMFTLSDGVIQLIFNTKYLMPSGLLVLDTMENGDATWHMHKILYIE